MSLIMWLAVGFLGGAGALARFGVGAVVSRRWGGPFPMGTFVVNVSGAVALGVLVGLAPSTDTMRLAGTALLGSYTTFSTWMVESERAGEGGRRAAPALNLVASLAFGLAGVAAGRWIGRVL